MAAELAEPQLGLEISHNSANSDVLRLSTSLPAAIRSRASTAPQWAEPAISVHSIPVPQPSSLAILAFAPCGLGAFRQYYGTRSSHFASG